MDFIQKTDGDYLEGGSDLRRTAQERQYLLKLVQEIAGVEGIERVRLGSLEPRIITREFAEGLAALPQVCPHFHLSLQSGCDATLKRMNRHYTAEEYYEKVKLLREVFAHPAITTDVIVGFPGETEEEFEATEAFLEKVCFFEMHVFKYSVRKGTAAALMEKQVPEQVKNERSARLIELEAGQEYTIQTANRMEKIPYKDIFYIQRDGKNSNIVSSTGTSKVRKSLQRVFDELNAPEFIFIDRGYIVNIVQIMKVSDSIAILKNGDQLPISRSHLQEVKRQINQFWGAHI